MYFLLLCLTIGVGVCLIFYRFSVVYNLIVSFSRLITLAGGERIFLLSVIRACVCLEVFSLSLGANDRLLILLWHFLDLSYNYFTATVV